MWTPSATGSTYGFVIVLGPVAVTVIGAAGGSLVDRPARAAAAAATTSTAPHATSRRRPVTDGIRDDSTHPIYEATRYLTCVARRSSRPGRRLSSAPARAPTRSA